MIDNTFELGKPLGAGGSAVVYEVTHQNGSQLAMKIINSAKVKNEKGYEVVLNESMVYDQLDYHPCIVNTKGCNPEGIIQIGQDHRLVRYILLEKCENGALSKIVRSTGPFEEKMAKIIFSQIAHAVKHVHDKGFAHMDIKLENILLDEYFNAKLSDFGTAVYVADNFGFTSKEVGTPGYIDPEILHRERRDSTFDGYAADIYSLGVWLNLLLIGEFPCAEQFKPDTDFESCESLNESWDSCSISDKKNYLPTGNIRLDRFNQLSQTAKVMLDEMLDEDPCSRPSIEEVLKSDWFSEDCYQDHTVELYEEMQARISYLNSSKPKTWEEECLDQFCSTQ